MQSQISRLEEFGWVLVIIAMSAVMAWLALNPFVDFLSGVNKIDKANTTPAVPVDLIPKPVNNEPILEIERII